MSEQRVELKDIFLLPNLWTSLQFITLPAMLYSAWQRDLDQFLLFYLISFAIDSTDGTLARKTGKCSKLGLYLDTYLDVTMYGLVLLSIYWFIPEFLSTYLFAGLGIFTITLLNRLASVIKFGRAIMLHLFTAKLMYFLLTLFLLDFYISGTPSDLLFTVLLVDAALFVLEELLIVILLNEPREDMLSVFQVVGRR